MAMLGTAANTQCNHYFQGYSSTLDLNAIANGSSCTLNDDVKYFDGDHCYDHFHLDYNKEVLKKTMLKHEAVFKDQIYELHRLYKRQRELMDETNRKSLQENHLMLEESHTNPGFSRTLSGYVPKKHDSSWLNPVCTGTSFSVAKNTLEDHCVDSDLLKSKCINSRKLLFDLELPADAYINSGEGVSDEDESDDRVPVRTCDMQRSQLVDRTKSMTSLVSPWKYYMDDSGRNPIAIQALPCFTNSVKPANSSKHLVVSKELVKGRIQHSNSSPSRGTASFLQGGLSNCSQSESEMPKAFPLSVSLSRVNWNNGFGLASKQHTSRKHVNPPDAKYLNLNLIPDTDVAVSHDVNLVSGKQVFENSGIEIGFKNNLSVYRDRIDLNSCINEDESSPIIPENKEYSPFRGESDENQVEIPFQHKDGDVERELARSAAEAIVFISSSVAESCQDKVAASSLSEVSFGGSLLWFAGIVAADTENSCDSDKCPLDETDYFEAMTLKLTETKVEEYWQKGSGQKQEITSATPLPNQVKRGRSRKRKDFQKEVLPGIASLSRNEVSEDLQTIIESAHALGTRYLGRNGSRGRGKRGSCNPTLDEAKSKVMGATQKQKESNSKLGIEGRLIGWGKITRGPRRQRHPASKQP